MKQLPILSCLLLLSVGFLPLRANSLPETPTSLSAELDQHLQLLLPGTGTQEQSTRAYAKDKIEAVILSLEAKKIQKKKPHKAFVLLREEVNQSILGQYEPLVDLRTVFTQGKYDQTTAAAVYALVLEHFSMLYVLRIEEGEVVLLVDNGKGTERIQIKGSPAQSAAAAKRFQHAYLELLQTVGYITSTEWNAPPDQLVERYYLNGTRQLNLRQLAGFLYYRNALKAYVDQAWVSSLDWLYRSQQLQPWPAQEVLRRAVWIQLANDKNRQKTALDYLWKIWERSPGDPWQSQLLLNFNQLLKNHPLPTTWMIDSTYHAFQQKFAAYPGALGQLREIYYLQSARFHAKQGNTVSVMNFMDSLYRYQPNNNTVQEVLAGMLVWSLRNSEREFSRGLDGINLYSRRYPFLHQNELFQDRHLFYQAERVRHYFDQDDRVQGLKYFEEFKQLAMTSPRAPRRDSWILTAYLAASNYYFRQGDYRQAHDLIQQARREAPAAPYLDHREGVLRKYF